MVDIENTWSLINDHQKKFFNDQVLLHLCGWDFVVYLILMVMFWAYYSQQSRIQPKQNANRTIASLRDNRSEDSGFFGAIWLSCYKSSISCVRSFKHLLTKFFKQSHLICENVFFLIKFIQKKIIEFMKFGMFIISTRYRRNEADCLVYFDSDLFGMYHSWTYTCSFFNRTYVYSQTQSLPFNNYTFTHTHTSFPSLVLWVCSC